MKFCDNPKCSNHVEVLYGNRVIRYIDTERVYKVNEVANYKCILPDNTELFFCDWCMGAINLYKKKQEKD